MDLVSYWVVGFSGNRHLEKPEEVRAALRRALRDLHELADRQLVAISSAAIGADLSALERELDDLVYALYGLTPEEIEMVEESAQR